MSRRSVQHGAAVAEGQPCRFTIRGIDVDSRLREWTYLESCAPDDFGALVLIYLLDAGDGDPGPWTKHWLAFSEVVLAAWRQKTSVTVVNAAILNELQGGRQLLRRSYLDGPAEDESAEDVLRRWAFEAVRSNERPGPVCPVHFITLEEYRAHVGEWEFVLDTETVWVSPSNEPSQPI